MGPAVTAAVDLGPVVLVAVMLGGVPALLMSGALVSAMVGWALERDAADQAGAEP